MTAVLDAPPEPQVLPQAPTVTEPGIKPVLELLDKLAALGTHKAIALFLAEQGYRGTCANAGLCPIALYLQAETGCIDIAVDEYEVTVWYAQGVYNSRTRVPAPVRDFIAFFDARLHPELIDPELPNNLAVAARVHAAGKAQSEPKSPWAA